MRSRAAPERAPLGLKVPSEGPLSNASGRIASGYDTIGPGPHTATPCAHRATDAATICGCPYRPVRAIVRVGEEGHAQPPPLAPPSVATAKLPRPPKGWAATDEVG